MNGTSHPNACVGMRCLRHEHWHQFAEPGYGIHAAIGLVMTLISFLSIAGNGFVIYVYTKSPALWSASNLLIINLSASDLLMAVTGFPLYIISSFLGRWPFPPVVCELYGFAGGAFGLASINVLAVISIDRFLVIVRAEKHRRTMQYKTAAKMLVVVWLYSIAWAAPPLFGWNRYTWEGFGTTCSFDYLTRTYGSKAFILAMTVGGFMVPLAVITYCYSYILYCVCRQRKHFQHSQAQAQARMLDGGDGKESGRRLVELETAKAIALMVGLYCLSWLPYTVVAIIGTYGDRSTITPLTSVIPGIFAKASTLYNPIVYVLCLPKFKQKLRAFALRLCCGIDELVTLEYSTPGGPVATSDMSDTATDSLDPRATKPPRAHAVSSTGVLDSDSITIQGKHAPPKAHTSSIEAEVTVQPIQAAAPEPSSVDIQTLAASINRNLILLRHLSTQGKAGGKVVTGIEEEDPQMEELERMLETLAAQQQN